MRRVSLVVLSVSVLLSGCGKSGSSSDTALGAFEQFDRAMRSGNIDAAVKLIDFSVTAAQGNSDWDSIPTGQRNEIMRRMGEDTAGKLRSMGYPSSGMTAQEQPGDGKVVKLVAQGEGKTLRLELRQTDEGWRITDGMPGMTTESGMQSTPRGGQ